MFRPLSLVVLVLTSVVSAQPEAPMTSGELRVALQKSLVLSSVLYIAAHPDDENTAFLAYCANGRKLRTAYLSLTRGDGGQNLIGSEQSEELGLIRTNELMAARRIDGAEQFFARAIDFGYSKSPEETFNKWNHEAVLSDVVWVIRQFRPDVIVTRFPSTGEGGHGQHTASAILAEEAFLAAADKNRFPEQLKDVEPWQAKRLVWNAWPQALKNFDSASITSLNLGEYNPLLGKSYPELAAESRSMHKSQGFGVSGRRGEYVQYFVHTAGQRAEGDLFENVGSTWGRVPGAQKIQSMLEDALRKFDASAPQDILPILAGVLKEIRQLPDPYWRNVKEKEIKRIIRSCAGLWMEAIADDYAGASGDTVSVEIGIVNRSSSYMSIQRVELPDFSEMINQPLEQGKMWSRTQVLVIPSTSSSQPFWLQTAPAGDLYTVSDQNNIGVAINKPAILVRVTLRVSGEDLSFDLPLEYRWSDPVKGELYRPFTIVPDISVALDETVMLFPDTTPKTIKVRIKAGKDKQSGMVRLDFPRGWVSDPPSMPFSMEKKYDESQLSFKLSPTNGASDGPLTVVASSGDKSFSQSWRTISYDHFPIQSHFPFASAKLLRIDVKRTRSTIGYIMGAGDDIPAYLRELGYKVTILSESDLESKDFGQFDAIITGVRCYNTLERLRFANKRLLDYVKQGGTLVVQYNTSHSLVMQDFSPYRLSLSRDRVTDETAAVTILDPGQRVMSIPNKIVQADFTHWIQERGLYFPDEWDDHFRPLLKMADPNEKETTGSLLISKYGEGAYIYTGLSFFRQIPAGVPGAYRLFVNLIEAKL